MGLYSQNGHHHKKSTLSPFLTEIANSPSLPTNRSFRKSCLKIPAWTNCSLTLAKSRFQNKSALSTSLGTLLLFVQYYPPKIHSSSSNANIRTLSGKSLSCTHLESPNRRSLTVTSHPASLQRFSANSVNSTYPHINNSRFPLSSPHRATRLEQ